MALLLSACTRDAEPRPPDAAPPDARDASVGDRSERRTGPALSWDTLPATRTLAGGVEVVDPQGVLAGRTVSVRALDLRSLAPSVRGAFAGWTIDPSLTTEQPVYLRLPLPAPRSPDERVLLLSFDPSDGAWTVESVARVLADGRRLIGRFTHFSSWVAIETIDRNLNRDLWDFDTRAACATPVSRTPSIPTVRHTTPPVYEGRSLPPGEDAERTTLTAATPLSRESALCLLVDMRARSTGIFFRNEERDPIGASPPRTLHMDEDFLVAPALAPLLEVLAEEVRVRSCGRLRIRVIEAFDSLREHPDDSLHYEGRAVDLTLCVVDASSNTCRTPHETFRSGLEELASLAYDVGFPFVRHEGGHVHASAPWGAPGVPRAVCHHRGVAGLVCTRGASGTAERLPGRGGDVRFVTDIAGAPMAPPADDSPLGLGHTVIIPPGAVAHSIDSAVGPVEIYGTLSLSSSTTVRSGYSFYLARTGRITCPGCDLTLEARAGVHLDGVIDLSAPAESARRDGGRLTVHQTEFLAPVMALPSIDTRGGDGQSEPGVPIFSDGARGGDVNVTALGDLTLGIAAGPGGFARRGPSLGDGFPCVQLAGPFLLSGIVTSGGVGGEAYRRRGLVQPPGHTGGAGGNLLIHVSADSNQQFGRGAFYNAFVATGGTPRGDSMYAINQVITHLGDGTEISYGVGSAGGTAYLSKGGPHGDGGPGGAAGSLRISLAYPAASCPATWSPSRAPIIGFDGVSTTVGDLFEQRDGRCSLAWTSAGGSGGVGGGTHDDHVTPYRNGPAGTAARPIVP